MNKILQLGRLARDPHPNSSGKTCWVTLAVDKPYFERRDLKEGEPTADFISFLFVGPANTLARDYLKKGWRVLVEGRVRPRDVRDDDGKIIGTENILVVDSVKILDRGRSGGAANEQQDEQQAKKAGDKPRNNKTETDDNNNNDDWDDNDDGWDDFDDDFPF